jgi:hypothetical protein
MNLHEIFETMTPGSITTIAGKGMQEGIPAKEADAGWPLGILRWNKTGELLVNDYHMHVTWRIDHDGILHRFAGTGIPGYSGDGGSALEARFNSPHDIAQDKHGNIVTNDIGNQVYRRIDAETGIVETIAGSGKQGRGGDGGPAIEAEMDTHCGVAIAENGDIYICSEWTDNIRRIDAKTGIIDLFAGHQARHYPSEVGNSKPFFGPGLSLGGYSGDGGPKETAGFYHPEHLAFDSKGDLYVCDNSNDRVRKIDMKTGIVSTVLGNGQRASNGDGGPATEASTLMPDAIHVDVHDNLYVGEKYGFRVRKVDGKTGIVTTIAGTGVPGMGEEGVKATETQVNSVEVGVWGDADGTVFYSDCGGRTRRIDGETGIVTTILGGTTKHDGEIATEGFLTGPNGLSVGPNGHIFFADVWGQRVGAIDPESGIIRTVAGNGARAYGGDGGPATEAYLGNPYDVSVDSKGTVVIADSRHGHIRRVDADGIIHNVAGAAFQWDKGDGGSALNANLVQVGAVAHDADDNIYFGDVGVGRIRKIDAQTGIIDTVVGVGLPGYSGDGGPATEARISAPASITFDSEGNLYVADQSNHVVRKVDLDGIITSIVGTGEQGFSPDGTPATEAKLDSPFGVAVSSDGTVYIADSENHLVRRVASDGTLETVAGSDEPGSYGDGGPATEAGLNTPYGIALYGDDILLIAEQYGHHVRAVKVG